MLVNGYLYTRACSTRLWVMGGYHYLLHIFSLPSVKFQQVICFTFYNIDCKLVLGGCICCFPTCYYYLDSTFQLNFMLYSLDVSWTQILNIQNSLPCYMWSGVISIVFITNLFVTVLCATMGYIFVMYYVGSICSFLG